MFSTKLFGITQRLSSLVLTRSYAKPNAPATAKKKKVGKLGPVVEKVVLPVESDVNRLVNYVCGSNIKVTGEDIKLKPESEYPDWLWNIHYGPPKPLSELDPTKKEYWRRLRKHALKRNNALSKLRRF